MCMNLTTDRFVTFMRSARLALRDFCMFRALLPMKVFELPRVDTCKDEGHSDASSIKRVTSSSEGDCVVLSMKKGSLSAATKSRI